MMKTKHYIAASIIAAACLFTGCSTIDTWINGDANEQEKKAGEKIESKKEEKQNEVNTQVDKAKSYVYGTDLSLKHVKEPSIEVKTAIELNKRVQSLIGGIPTQKEILEIETLVKNMNSSVEAERKLAAEMLAERDKFIIKSQSRVKELESELETAYDKYKKVAQTNANKASEFGEYKDKMESWFGLGAIFYGIKHFIISCITTILIVSVIFLVLRLLASANPIAGAIFGIFEGIVASVLKMVSGIFPKAMELAGRVHISDFTAVKDSRNKLIDVIEEMKRDVKNNPGKTYTIQDLLTKLSVEFSDSDKAEINRALKDLNWTK